MSYLKIISIFFIVFSSIFNQSFATWNNWNNWGWNSNNWNWNVVLSEEAQCFLQLSSQVKSDVRFSNLPAVLPNKDLTKVLFDEVSWSYIDLTKYNEFLSNAARNPSHVTSRESFWLTNTDFLLRRQHIATVIANDNYVVTKVVWFWRDSNFTFPLPALSWKSYWDPYQLKWNMFKEFIAYTHHSITWDFLSCWIFKVTPLSSRSFWEISEAGYFTNILYWMSNQSSLWWSKCTSWFEWNYITANDGKQFYSMKSNVCVLDYAQKDFVKMELVSVAYNNNSNYFNEYIVFPLQVQAMKNTDLVNNWLVEIRNKFLDYLDTRTCLRLIHWSSWNLPSWCNWSFSSKLLSYEKNPKLLDKVYAFFFSNAYAAREFNFSESEIDKASWMIVYENMPYDLYKKLLSIENTAFKDFIKMALAPNFERYILERKKQWILISPYEETFLKCNISYKEREEIIIDFLKDLKDPKKLDLNNLTYSNPKFWDCIVPYPDKRNLAKVIPESFESNQLLAEQLSWEYKWPDVNDKMIKLVEEQKKLTIEYQNTLDKLTEDFNNWKITWDDLNLKVEEEKKLFDDKIQKIISENENLSQEIEKTSESLDTWWIVTNKQIDKTNNINIVIIWLILVVLWLISMFYVVKNKK